MTLSINSTKQDIHAQFLFCKDYVDLTYNQKEIVDRQIELDETFEEDSKESPHPNHPDDR